MPDPCLASRRSDGEVVQFDHGRASRRVEDGFVPWVVPDVGDDRGRFGHADHGDRCRAAVQEAMDGSPD